jgi:hypothetical protein
MKYLLHYSRIHYQTRPEINFRANSSNPLKWTENLSYLVLFSGLWL